MLFLLSIISLPSCPTQPFSTPKSLQDFLLEEIFCIKVDNRNTATADDTVTYSQINQSTYVPDYTASNLSDTNEFLSPILLENGSQLLLPGSSSGFSCSNSLPVRFLESASSQCFNNNTITPSSFNMSIREAPNSQTTINASLTCNGTSTCGDNSTVTEANVLIEFNETSSLISNISISLTTNSSGSDGQLMKLNLNYVASGSQLLIQSGEIGYQDELPVIAGYYNSTANTIRVYNQSTSGTFPIVYGECQTYTTLKFNVDTLSGVKGSTCNFPNVSDQFYVNVVAKYGNPDPANINDWVQIEFPSDTTVCNAKRIYTIYTRKLGTVASPINTIQRVTLQCSTGTDHVTIASFLALPQNERKYIGYLPRTIVKLPSDFFYPFK